MATTRNKTPKAATARKSVGLGFVPKEAQHGFLVSIPKGRANDDLVFITEHRGEDLSIVDDLSRIETLSLNDRNLRVMIDRRRWLELAPSFWQEANHRLRANALSKSTFKKNPSKPIPVHASLGKELCILCWSVEEASIDDIPNAIRNWEALVPQERWWLYTMTVATSGQAMQKGLGWRKALRAALADSPFVKGEGSSPKARREMLGHQQLALEL